MPNRVHVRENISTHLHTLTSNHPSAHSLGEQILGIKQERYSGMIKSKQLDDGDDGDRGHRGDDGDDD